MTNGIIADFEQIKMVLTHWYPFLLFDRVVEFEKDRRIIAQKDVSDNPLPEKRPAREYRPFSFLNGGVKRIKLSELA